jgi:hypothetical protein
MTTKLDLRQMYKHLYTPSKREFSVVDVPALAFLMIDGMGDPNSAPAYQEAVNALYSVAYTMKFAFKKERGIDYPVMALEGLWWADDMAQFVLSKRDDWQWTMMIMQPDIVTAADVEWAAAETARKKDLPGVKKLRLEAFHEGLSVQIMHIGPYSAEGPTIARLHQEYLPAHGYVPTGKHHEIYLSDPRRAAPEKWKTILRQPVRAK